MANSSQRVTVGERAGMQIIGVDKEAKKSLFKKLIYKKIRKLEAEVKRKKKIPHTGDKATLNQCG